MISVTPHYAISVSGSSAQSFAAATKCCMTTVVTEETMRKIQLKDAKARLSSVVDQAVRGKPSVITRHGKAEAVVLGFADWERLSRVPSFGRLLMAAPLEPGDVPMRDQTPLRTPSL
jgi:prevent-host-death family protein